MSSQIVEGFFPALTSALKQRDGVWESMFPSESQLSCPVTTATLRAETDFPITLRWPALFPLLIFGVALGLVQFAVLQSDGISRHFNPGEKSGRHICHIHKRSGGECMLEGSNMKVLVWSASIIWVLSNCMIVKLTAPHNLCATHYANAQHTETEPNVENMACYSEGEKGNCL